MVACRRRYSEDDLDMTSAMTVRSFDWRSSASRPRFRGAPCDEPTGPERRFSRPAVPRGRSARRGRSRSRTGAAKHWLLSAIVWLTVVDLFGLVLATEFVTPEAFGEYLLALASAGSGPHT